ncbi:MAG: transporter substrate-binding domain-containing protein [Robiginitomaculum sp.]|nr:transporter substrate-binding domain-containing protein [Robiginitomaculum sp.]
MSDSNTNSALDKKTSLGKNALRWVWKKLLGFIKWLWSVIIWLILLVLAVLITKVIDGENVGDTVGPAVEAAKSQTNFMEKWQWPVVLLVLYSVGMTGLLIWQFVRIYKLNKKGGQTQATLNLEKYDRFEDIKKNGVKYGYIEFYPTLKINAQDEVEGFGLDLLTKVFKNTGVTLSGDHDESTWENLLDGLNNKIEGENRYKYDIIATPLYEYTERSNSVEFCKPLFYSDIGAFISTDGSHWKALIKDKSKFGFNELISKLNELGKGLYIRSRPGELQEKICSKYLSNFHKGEAQVDKWNLKQLLACLSKKDNDNRSDILFYERWQVERMPQFIDKNIINLLQPKELLYPVGFVVRKSDDTLRKFIDLRLMEIEDEAPGILEVLKNSLSKDDQKIFGKKEGEYFYRGVDSHALTSEIVRSDSGPKM